MSSSWLNDLKREGKKDQNELDVGCECFYPRVRFVGGGGKGIGVCLSLVRLMYTGLLREKYYVLVLYTKNVCVELPWRPV